MTPDASATPPLPSRLAWAMLLALTAAFCMSQAFRSIGALLAPPLQQSLGLDARQLGTFTAGFHFAFGLSQLLVGIAIDLYGIRRTILVAFPVALAGALLSATATSYPWLVAGQWLIGIGCSPAFVVCTVFVARYFPPARFAAISGILLGLGGLGMLLTGSPLAWLIEAVSWRASFVVLAVGCALAWLAIAWRVHEPPRPAGQAETLGSVLRGFAGLFALPHTWGIVVMGGLTYAAVMALRGLWVGPLLVDSHKMSLVSAGHVVLVMSVLMIASAPIAGRLDPGDATRRFWIIACTLVSAALYAALALAGPRWLVVVLPCLIGLLSSYIVMQYADVRAAYPAALTGRAMSVFTMAMFLGVAIVQWLTGQVAAMAVQAGHDPVSAALWTLVVLLVAGSAAFAWLPAPARSAPVPAPG